MTNREFIDYFVALADTLDSEGFNKCAGLLDDAMSNNSIVKVAQYVGAIGYVLKQERAMSNCIRKKRVASSGSMQEVVLDCLKEYQDSQSYTDTEWTSKYAQVVKSLPDKFSSCHKDFIKEFATFNDIDKHIELVRTAQIFLSQHGKSDDILNQIIEGFDALNNLIEEKKEN